MRRMVTSAPLAKLRTDGPQIAAKTRVTSVLDESEEDAPEAQAGRTRTSRSECLGRSAAMVRCLDTYTGRATASRQTPLDRALEATGSGCLDGSLRGGRRSAAARRALREAS